MCGCGTAAWRHAKLLHYWQSLTLYVYCGTIRVLAEQPLPQWLFLQDFQPVTERKNPRRTA